MANLDHGREVGVHLEMNVLDLKDWNPDSRTASYTHGMVKLPSAPSQSFIIFGTQSKGRLALCMHARSADIEPCRRQPPCRSGGDLPR